MKKYFIVMFMGVALFVSLSQYSFSDSIQVGDTKYDNVYVQKMSSRYVIYNPENAKVIEVSSKRFDVNLLNKFLHRTHLIKAAFGAHQRGEYYLSIPVFFAYSSYNST